MAQCEQRDMIRGMGMFLEKYGPTVVIDAVMTAVWVEADNQRNEMITCMGSCEHAEEVLAKYDLYVFVYQQLKQSMEVIRDFEKRDGVKPLAGTYWPCPMR